MASPWVNPDVRRVSRKRGDLPSVSSRSLAIHLQFNMPVRPDLLQLRWDGFEPRHVGPFILSGWFWLSLPAIEVGWMSLCRVSSKRLIKMPESTEPVKSHRRCRFQGALFGYYYSASCESTNLYLSWPPLFHLMHHFMKCLTEIKTQHDLVA